MANHLYHTFGFDEVGRMSVTVPGEKAGLDIPVVLRDPKEDNSWSEKRNIPDGEIV